jgi:hypothetical protein
MATEQTAKRKPCKVWKSRTLDVSLWETKNEHGTFFSVKAVHRFKRSQDNSWDESSSFDYTDLPMLVELLGAAFKEAMKADILVREEHRMVDVRYKPL